MSTPERRCSIPDDSVSAEFGVPKEPLSAADPEAEPAPNQEPAGERPTGYEPL